MIKTFRDRETETLLVTGRSRRFSRCAKQAFQILRMLEAATTLADLAVPPGNRLELLRGDRQGQHSIRVNDQYRICFEWPDGHAYNVELTDYHRGERAMSKRLSRKPLHPGAILRDQFMAEFGLSAARLARDLGVPVSRIADIVGERRAVSPDTALRLARYFGTSAEFWMNLQSAYALDVARVGLPQIEADVHPIAC